MKKTVKKLDNNVVKALTLVCEDAKQWAEGFLWLTHTAKYDCFPSSLIVTCVFETNDQVAQCKLTKLDNELRRSIQKQLLKVGIVLKDARQNMRLDSQEQCELEHNGDWKRRLQF